jgi:crotonobetaine/carnitine-CoA ligase
VTTTLRTVARALEDAAKSTTTGYRFVDDDGRGEPFFSHAGLERVSARLGGALQALGLKKGDRVALILPDNADFVFTFLGAVRAGIVPVPIYPPVGLGKLAGYLDNTMHIVGKSGARVVVTSAEIRRLLGGVHQAAPQLAQIVDVETLRAQREELRPVDVRLDDVCFLQFTSGSTSRPKGVLWTHANALWGARINASHQALRADDVHMVTLPLFHTNAQAYSMLATMWAGASAVVNPRFSASRFWDVSMQEGCTWASVIGFIPKALMDQPVPQHRYRLWGTGVCEPPWDAHFKVKTLGWWGMTETITHGTVGLVDLPNASMSMGLPAPEYGIRIEVDGREALPGETGEFLIKGVRGLSLFAEYLNNPQATADSFDEHGWFKTGDRVTLGEDGWLYFADRSKDMLKVGGENVAASEIEQVIAVVPGVLEVAIVGLKHPMLDEVPVAFVRAQASDDASRAALVAAINTACSTTLSGFKQPREVRIVEELPRSTLEKINKAALRRMLNQEKP